MMNRMNEQRATLTEPMHDMEKQSSDPVTLADIAQATGFSTMTVSNALRGKPNVSAANREKIRAAAQAMGYQANVAAMILRNKRSGIIQVVVDDFEVPFHARIAKYLTQEATKFGYQTLVRQSSSSEREEIRAIKPNPGLVCDGIILDAPNITEDQVIGHVQGRPVLVIGDCASFKRVDSMDTACTDGVAAMVEHLWQQGCRTFRVLGAPRPSGQSEHHDTGKGFGPRRVAAIEQALAGHGITMTSAQYIGGEWTLEGGYEAAGRMLDEPAWQDDLDAGSTPGVICLSDTIALGALRMLSERGVTVPDTVKITGCDGLLTTGFSNPPLTTIEMDVPAMAHNVIKRMVAMIESRNHNEPASPVVHETVPFHLVTRDSSAVR